MARDRSPGAYIKFNAQLSALSSTDGQDQTDRAALSDEGFTRSQLPPLYDLPARSAANTAETLTVADGADVEIRGVSAQNVAFFGTTGTLQLEDSRAFSGQISGLTGSDALDLADLSYEHDETVTFSGNSIGGVLTIADGSQKVNIQLVGNYLSSTWDLSADGNGGTIVVDPVSPNNWQTVGIGAGGFLTGIDIAPDDTRVVRTDTYGAYIWNGSAWQQLISPSSMPAGFVAPNENQNGVYEIQIAPSDSQILYMMYEGDVFKSTNQGASWTTTSFATVIESSNDAYRMDGQKMQSTRKILKWFASEHHRMAYS